jgi:endonuclease YncB( thermonuclease family)
MGSVLSYGRRRRATVVRLAPQIAVAAALLVLVAGSLLFGNFDWPAFSSIPSSAFQALGSSAISVTDGDTIRLDGRAVRLVGFNSPETYRAACEREQQLGDLATRRLQQLVAAGNVDFAAIPCSCTQGTEGTSECNFGRACGTLRANGRDVGTILISEGLAVPFHCGATSCPRLPRPWCG